MLILFGSLLNSLFDACACVFIHIIFDDDIVYARFYYDNSFRRKIHRHLLYTLIFVVIIYKVPLIMSYEK